MSRLESWLGENSGVSMFAVGVALVLFAAFVASVDAVATAIAVVGATAMVLAVLLPRVEGALKIGPGGLEVILAAVARESTDRDLDAETSAEAIVEAVRRWNDVLELTRAAQGAQHALAARVEEVGDASPANEFARNVVDDVTAMEDVALTDVPAEATQQIIEALGRSVTPVTARRRRGRGAPRWEIQTEADGGWRVTNTRHGWSATRVL